MYRIYLNDAQRCLKRMIDNVGKQYRKNINYWNSTILKYRFSFSKQLCISLIEFDSYFRLSVGPSSSSLFPQCSTYIIVGSGWRTIWDGEYHFHRINNNNNNDSAKRHGRLPKATGGGHEGFSVTAVRPGMMHTHIYMPLKSI